MSDDIVFTLFNAKASDYDGNNACILAQLCRESYKRGNVKKLGDRSETNEEWRQRVKQEAVTWGFESDHVYCFDNKGSQAILLTDTEKVIIVFRGSDEKSDWEININRLEDEMFEGHFNVSVHTGFLHYLKCIWEPYTDPQDRREAKGIKAILLEELKDAYKTVWIAGHSLGGAAAILAATACMWEEEPIEVSGVYTYGQPRVGDSRFADVYNTLLGSKTFRFVNNNDIVTKIPTWAPYFIFCHVGQIKYLTEKGDIVDYEKLNWCQRLRDIFGGIADDLFDYGLDSISDHSIGTGYVPPLRRVLLKQPLSLQLSPG